jgi:hypothetical protein
MAVSPNGRRSVTVSINVQITPTVGDPEDFKALRRAEERAVCAALAGKEKPEFTSPGSSKLR